MTEAGDTGRRLEAAEAALAEVRQELAATNQGLLSLTVELERRVDQQTALAELGQRALDGVALGPFMAEITTVLARIVDARYCAIFEYLADRDALLLRGVEGARADLVDHAMVPAGHASQAGFTFLSGSPVVVEDIASEDRFAPSSLALEHGAVGGISVVISGRRHPFGVLAAYTDRPRTFNADDTSLMQAVANLLAMSIEHKQAQTSLRNSERRFRSLFENVVEGVFRSTRDGRLVLVNPALVRMLGYESEGELCALRWQELYCNLDDLHLSIGRLETDGELRDAELTMRRKDGREIILLKNARLVDDEDGEPYVEGTLTDITKRKHSEAQLKRLANYDSLTNLFNRRRFELELETQLEGAAGRGNRGALLWLDVDHFKHINDTFGHAAGDSALIRCAGLLRASVRESDVVARVSGDEFAVLMPGATGADAESVAGDVQEELRRATICFDGQMTHLTVSIGIASFPEHATTLQGLLVCADLAMYAAKEAGRNRARLYGPDEHDDESRDQLGWATFIRESLGNDAFTLHAQPILDLCTDRISQYELLLRMPRADGTLILPGVLLSNAERFGLAEDVDQWVVCRAIRLLAQQRPAGHRLRVQVNLTARSLSGGGMLDLLEREIAARDVDPECLTFEITETAAISNIPEAQRFTHRLRALGCRFALNEFGMGFSSFYYLKHLSVDYLKIDGGFIQQLPSNPIDQHLVQAIVRVARGLGTKTIAEFVEDEPTLELVKEYGVDYAQGHYIGMPASLDLG